LINSRSSQISADRGQNRCHYDHQQCIVEGCFFGPQQSSEVERCSRSKQLLVFDLASSKLCKLLLLSMLLQQQLPLLL